MNTRPHCRTSPPIGIGGQPMPGGITTNSRTGFAASRPSADFRIPNANCWTSPDATMLGQIGSAAEPQTDDRRPARVGLVGNGRAAGVRNVAADHQALAPSAPSPCRSCARRLVMLRRRQGLAVRLRSELGEHRLQSLNAGRQRIAIIVNSPAQQRRERVGLFTGQIEHHLPQIGRFTKGGQRGRQLRNAALR